MEQLSAYEIAKALNAEYHGEDVAIDHISTDSRDLSGNCLFVALEGERTDGHRYVAAALRGGARLAAVQKPVEGLTPEEESRLLRVENTFYAPLAIAAAYRRRYSLLTVGVTGSVGKTTTKDFIAAVLSARYKTLKSQGNHNNEFGLPVTVFELDPSYQAGVFEMGMDARGDISRLTAVVKPDIGVITNVGVSHLERLGTRENILAAKLEITEGMADGSPLILCGDNDLLSTVEIPRLRVLRYGIEAPELDARAEEIVTGEGETRFVIVWKGGRYPARIPAMGRHNAMNALAGFLVGIEAGMTSEEAAEALSGYAISGMRQRVRLWNGIKVVEDCYNASPDSMRAALQTLAAWPGASRRIAVLADMLELGNLEEAAHLEIGRLAAQLGVDLVLAYGPAARLYVQGAEGARGQARHFETKAALLQALQGTLRPGDVVWFKGSHSMALEEVLEGLYTA